MSDTLPPDPAPSSPVEHVDIAVIGAGAAGTSAASAFAKQGYAVALIDLHQRHPVDFRAEKIGQVQMDFLEQFGLGEAAYGHMTAFDGVWVHRFGRIIEKKTTREYASHYQDLINALRTGLTPKVKTIIGRVDAIAASDALQSLTLSDGRRLSARLLVVATGLGDVVRRKLGMERSTSSPGHSLSFGFDLTNKAADFPFPSLVMTAERPADKAAYLTIFPVGDKMRANLFAYRQVTEPWSHAFRKETVATLRDFMPALERLFGPIGVAGSVTARPIDLMKAEGYVRPGVVLLGDAFFTVCPSSGTGMDKALHDVSRLLQYAPRWFDTPGMGADKIAQFYDDDTKRALDAHALKISWRARSMRMDPGVLWTARRLRSAVLTRGAYRVRDLLQPITGRRSAERR